jgi:hypothetical protein
MLLIIPLIVSLVFIAFSSSEIKEARRFLSIARKALHQAIVSGQSR